VFFCFCVIILSPLLQVQSDYLSAFGSNPSIQMPDSKYSRASISSPSGSAGPHPPLPPTPPPFSSSPYNLPSLNPSTSQSSVYTVGTNELPQTSTSPPIDPRLGNLSVSGAGLTSYMPPPLMPPMVFSRPATIPVTPYGSIPTQQQGESPNVLQNLSIPQPSVQSIHQLQPLQPPLQRPPQPPQHLWSPAQSSQQLKQGGVFAKSYSNARPSITNAATTTTPFCACSLSSSAARAFSVKAAAS